MKKKPSLKIVREAYIRVQISNEKGNFMPGFTSNSPWSSRAGCFSAAVMVKPVCALC
jgi:hypothetical protein